MWSDPHLASEGMHFCPYSYHHQHCQSVSHLRSVPSYSQRISPQRICYLPSSQETCCRRRPTLKLLSNLSHIQHNLTCGQMLTDLVSNGLLNPNQSAYCKHHSLKQPYCISMIISSMPSDHRSCHAFASLICLPLLIPSTNDHNILITRLSSWFRIHSSVLNWFKSYLLSRSFRVKCYKDFSSEHISSCGAPQGSVLGPLLFVMYTTPLSTLIFSLSPNHQFTQIMLNFFLVPSL